MKKLSDYTELVEKGVLPVERGLVRTGDDAIRRDVIHELMCNFRVEMADVEQRFGIDFHEYFRVELERLQKHEVEGLARVLPDRIEATDKGELFVRNLAMCFDRYWWEKHAQSEKKTFSRTV
ncbi:MAG: hypothetical protein R3E12_12375 [Candidatus Eisenbacteria bacterium]